VAKSSALKKATVPAIVEFAMGTNVFDFAATKPNAVILLDSNTISIQYTPAFHQFKPEVQKALLAAELTSPILSLQSPLLPNGKVDTESNSMVIAALSDKTEAYDGKKLGHLREFPGGYFIHTHYHGGAGSDFSYALFEESLRNYCEMAYLMGAKDRPVVINLPGLQCNCVYTEARAVKPQHIERVKEIIENTMFENTTVYLVL